MYFITPHPTAPLPLPPPSLRPPPLPIAPIQHSLASLIRKAQTQLDRERSKLYEDAAKTNTQSTENLHSRKIQTTKTLLITHAASNFLLDKLSNAKHMKHILTQRHVERAIPCGHDPATPCATLAALSTNLRAQKLHSSDADLCDALSHTSCGNCTALAYCGWCAAERTCLEGNAEAPRFGEACSASWYHQFHSQRTCLALEYSTVARANPIVSFPKEPMDVPLSDLTSIFDPACAHFAGSPGDCERAKLRLESIFIRCLAEQRTRGECEQTKISEGKRIAQEQLSKEVNRKEGLQVQLAAATAKHHAQELAAFLKAEAEKELLACKKRVKEEREEGRRRQGLTVLPGGEKLLEVAEGGMGLC